MTGGGGEWDEARGSKRGTCFSPFSSGVAIPIYSLKSITPGAAPTDRTEGREGRGGC